jgi:hypothetical protein
VPCAAGYKSERTFLREPVVGRRNVVVNERERGSALGLSATNPSYDDQDQLSNDRERASASLLLRYNIPQEGRKVVAFTERGQKTEKGERRARERKRREILMGG